jgi:ATP-dependent Clp protease ATP-binding subunit ClpA
MVRELAAQLGEKKVTLTVDDAGRAWLAEHGTSPLYGARPMSRLIQVEIARPLADRILFGDLKGGGAVTVTVTDSRLLIR